MERREAVGRHEIDRDAAREVALDLLAVAARDGDVEERARAERARRRAGGRRLGGEAGVAAPEREADRREGGEVIGGRDERRRERLVERVAAEEELEAAARVLGRLVGVGEGAVQRDDHGEVALDADEGPLVLHLARLELRIMIEAFLRRVSSFAFDMDKALRLPSSFQWGWNSLPVIIREGS